MFVDRHHIYVHSDYNQAFIDAAKASAQQWKRLGGSRVFWNKSDHLWEWQTMHVAPGDRHYYPESWVERSHLDGKEYIPGQDYVTERQLNLVLNLVREHFSTDPIPIGASQKRLRHDTRGEDFAHALVAQGMRYYEGRDYPALGVYVAAKSTALPAFCPEPPALYLNPMILPYPRLYLSAYYAGTEINNDADSIRRIPEILTPLYKHIWRQFSAVSQSIRDNRRQIAELFSKPVTGTHTTLYITEFDLCLVYRDQYLDVPTAEETGVVFYPAPEDEPELHAWRMLQAITSLDHMPGVMYRTDERYKRLTELFIGEKASPYYAQMKKLTARM